MNRTRNAPSAFSEAAPFGEDLIRSLDDPDSGDELSGFMTFTPIGSKPESSTFRAIDGRRGNGVVLRIYPDRGFRLRRPGPKTLQPCHPGIAAFRATGECSRGVYLVREYVEGIDLGNVMASRVSLTVREIVDLAIQLIEILEVSHRHGEFHGHLVPPNIILEPSGCVQVTDWGLSGTDAQASRSMREDRQQAAGMLGRLMEKRRTDCDPGAVSTCGTLSEILDRLSSDASDGPALDAALTSLSILHDVLGIRRRVALSRRASLFASF